MASEAEALAAIQTIKATVTNVAGDVTELVALAHQAGGVPQSVMDGLMSLQTTLAGVAAEWPPVVVPPVEPPVEPPPAPPV